MTHGVSIRCPHWSTPGSGQYHTRYDGVQSKAPKRTRCEGCGGTLVRTATVWGAVEWRADGRYECPAVTYTSPEQAQAACTGEQVARSFSFIP